MFFMDVLTNENAQEKQLPMQAHFSPALLLFFNAIELLSLTWRTGVTSDGSSNSGFESEDLDDDDIDPSYKPPTRSAKAKGKSATFSSVNLAVVSQATPIAF